MAQFYYICETNSAEAISMGNADTIHIIKQMPRVGVPLWGLYSVQSLRVENCWRKRTASGKRMKIWAANWRKDYGSHSYHVHGYIAAHIPHSAHICVRELIKLFANHMMLWLFWTCFWIKKSFRANMCPCAVCTVFILQINNGALRKGKIEHFQLNVYANESLLNVFRWANMS